MTPPLPTPHPPPPTSPTVTVVQVVRSTEIQNPSTFCCAWGFFGWIFYNLSTDKKDSVNQNDAAACTSCGGHQRCFTKPSLHCEAAAKTPSKDPEFLFSRQNIHLIRWRLSEAPGAYCYASPLLRTKQRAFSRKRERERRE